MEKLIFTGYALGGSLALTVSNDYQLLIAMNIFTVVVLLIILSRRPMRGLEFWTYVFAANALARLVAWTIRRSDAVNKASKFRRWDAFAATLGYAVTMGYIMTTIVPGKSVARYVELTALGIPSATALILATTDSTDDLAPYAEISKTAYASPTIVDKTTDTRVLVTGNIIAFAGTKSWKNVITDVNISDVSFLSCKNPKMRVHTGFMRAWQSVRVQVIDAVRSYDALVIAGHSLGGALATLAGLDFACQGKSVSTITFGAPQVGDEHFADAFNAHVANSHRVVIPLDPIPRSLSSQFTHVKGVQFIPMLTINPHAMESYIDAVKLPKGQRLLGLALPLLVATVLLVHRRRSS